MALIAMAVYDTEENKRTELTKRTIDSLLSTVDFNRHRMYIVDNGSCQATQDLYKQYIADSVCEGMKYPITVIFLKENIGTARAINQAWKLREPGEHCIKMDNDVVINQAGWIDEMEAAIKADPLIGQVGLKRKDCWENPSHDNPDYKSELVMLPHIAGEQWRIVEKVKHVIGTCVMHSYTLLDKVGYLYQPSLYGYDDVIMSHRSQLSGFYNCFLPHINIDHIDQGETAYQGWKEKHSGEQTQNVIQLVRDMHNGIKSIYYGAED